MTSHIRVLVGAAIATGVCACADYARTNPYDPVVAVAFAIAGPDTLFSWGETGVWTVTTSPAMPDSAFDFNVPLFTPIGRTGAAEYVNSDPPLYPATTSVTLKAMVGGLDTVKTIDRGGAPVSVPDRTFRHSASKLIVLTQRLTKIALRCPTVHACDTLSIGGSASVWVDGSDALGSAVNGLSSPAANPVTGSPIATYVVRDTTVASFVPVGVRVATVTAKKTGVTWIVGTNGAMSDSLRLVVR